MTEPTVRHPFAVTFYTYWKEEIVLVTIDCECDRVLHCYESTDEGYESEFLRFVYDSDDGVVTREWANASRDCDGTHRVTGIDHCEVRRLATMQTHFPTFDPTGNALLMPDWQRGESTIHDTYAQAAGY